MLEEEVRIMTQEREKEGKQGNEEDRKEESHVASAPIVLDVASTGVTQWSQRDGKDEKQKVSVHLLYTLVYTYLYILY